MSARYLLVMFLSAAASESVDANSLAVVVDQRPGFFGGIWNGLVGLKTSSVTLYESQKESMALRKQRKENPDSITFDLHHKVTQAGADFGKVLSLTWLTIYARWYTPVTVYFFPDMLPSTFESEKARVKKRDEFEERRRKAVLAAVDLEDADATKALNARSKAKAVDAIAKAAGDREFRELPNPVFYSTSRVFDGPFRIFPKPLHVRAIRQGLKRIAEGDEALRRSQLESLPPRLLETACAERGISSCKSTQEMVDSLSDWLAMTPDTFQEGPAAENARLALIAANTVSSIRKTEKAKAALYGRNTF